MPPLHQSPEPNQSSRQQAQTTYFYLDVLHKLINLGTDLARVVHQQATADPAEATVIAADPAPDHTIAFERITRTIRRTIVLARRMAEPLPERAANHHASEADQRRTAARKQVIRAVEDDIQSRAHGTARIAAAAEALHAELMDRMDRADLDDFDLDRPVVDIILDIRRDLGMAAVPGEHLWKRRTPTDIALLCALAAAPRRSPASPSVVQAIPPSAWPGSDPPAAPA